MSGGGDIGTMLGVLNRVADVVVATQREVIEIRLRLARVEEELGRKADKDDIVVLRQAVTGYHASFMGHGILASELDGRVRRIERRLDMGAAQ
jgi:hypothetical protein